MATKLASFPNSRIQPRPVTNTRDTEIVAVGNGANTLLAPANVNRSDITLRNEGPSDIRYDYFDNPAMLIEGFLLKFGDVVTDDSPQAIYAQAVDPAGANVDVNEGQG